MPSTRDSRLAEREVRPRFEERLATSWPPHEWADVTVLVAVSGGADSVALLRGLLAIRAAGPGRLLIAHYNHRLRGTDSDDDQQWVEELARAHQVPILVGQASPAAEPGCAGRRDVASEESWRNQRLAFLQATAQAEGARFLVTAHNGDDQAETILFRVLRGTGLAGLAGIPRTRPLTPFLTLIRPLLAFRRHEIVEYLDQLRQSYREDHTNRELRFSRNRIRHELLPLLREGYRAGVVEALLRLGEAAAEAHSIVAQQAEALLAECLVSQDSLGVILDVAPLRASHESLVREALVLLWKRHTWPLRDMSRSKWAQLAAFARTESGPAALLLPAGIRVAWDRAVGGRCLVIRRVSPNGAFG